MLGQYRFRMKLYAIGWLIAMGEGHDLGFVGTCRYLEMLPGCFIQLDNERMVATDAKWGRELAEQPSAVMRYAGGPTMHRTTSAHHASAEDAPYTLMSKANAENWDAT
ncbi:hypothetical protein FBZ93_11640 [Bradyrhizobium macuxiense]|uniref:Uncharacterized protein n=1 Tax=Bradyrhizobium macuxiense TaxID=1755647 RepID=A0A560L1J9_9BRAD|nr:hypothetical protein FBZ93_11640 [Bradyrhizobium macuxiense]